jgi:hypothetical protein
MTILRHLYLTSACRLPDEPAAAEPVLETLVDPAPAPAPEPVAAVEPPAEPEPAPAPSAAAALSPAPERMVSARVFEKTAFELREDRRQERARADDLARKNADLQAIIDRMQAGNVDPAAAPAARPAAAPATTQQPADFQAAVQAEASKQRLYDDTLVVRSAGLKDFPDFNQSLGILTAIGATNDDFVSDILAVDKGGAHVLIDKLAKDPEKAATLVTMDSRRRIAELTRMTIAPAAAQAAPVAAPPAAPAAPAISRAPAPAPRMAPVATAQEVDPTTPEGDAKMSDAQWEKWAKSQGGVDGLLKRRA